MRTSGKKHDKPYTGNVILDGILELWYEEKALFFLAVAVISDLIRSILDLINFLGRFL